MQYKSWRALTLMTTTNSDVTTEYANSIFEQPWYIDAVTNGNWTEVKVEEKDAVVARWAVPYDGNKIKMPGETQTLGIWFAPNTKLSKQQKYIEELVRSLPKKSGIDLMLDPINNYFLPFKWLGFKISPRITYRFTDVTDIEAVRAKYDKTVRKNIKSASNKVEIIEDSSIDNLYDMLKKTFENQGRSCPHKKEFIKKIFDTCNEHDAAKIITAVDNNNNVHASSLFIYDENTCYYLIAGADPKFRSSGAQTLVLDAGIEFASKHSRAFDFEGSMIEGIENFFRRFGADRVLYYQVEKKGLIGEMMSILKPRIKKLLRYKN